jgi:hypothetical protein
MLYLVFAGEHVGLKFVRHDGDAIAACPSSRCLPSCRIPDATGEDKKKEYASPSHRASFPGQVTINKDQTAVSERERRGQAVEVVAQCLAAAPNP